MRATSNNAGDPVPEDFRFIFLSGRLCLAFCATVGERWRRNFDRLRVPGDLARWHAEAAVADDPVKVTGSGLRQARALREAIYRTASNISRGQAPAPRDERIISAAAGAPPPVPRMHHGASTLTAAGPGAEASALSAIARDAIELFTTPLSGRIRECASPQCGLLFLDLSRPGRRRWCSSSACGGKARAAAYRQRTARPASTPGC